jgi:hypothetical protein
MSVQRARPRLSPPGQSQQAKRVLGAGTKKVIGIRTGKRLELLERLKRLEQPPLNRPAGTLEP